MAIKKDSVVTLNFILRDALSNEILEDNTNHSPISFLLGRGQVLEALEKEIEKLNVNDSADVLIKKENAWQEYDEALIQELPKEQFAGIDLYEGMELFGENEDGSSVRVTVKSIADDKVTIDYNHPYAGKDLLFSLNIVDVRDATEDEILSGYVKQSGGCGCGGHGCCSDDEDEHECCGGHGGCGCGGHGHNEHSHNH